MSLIYLFAASKLEGGPIERLAASRKTNDNRSDTALFSSGANDFALVITGMGTKRAKAAAEMALGQTASATLPSPMFARRPNAVVAIGLCGGLSASLSEGRIVAYTDCLSTYKAKPPLSCSPSITDAITKLLASFRLPCDRVVGVTSPQIATNREQRLDLAKSGATVVDMESYSILAAASRAGVPAVVIRVVSDSVDRQLPDFNRALNDDGALDGRKALGVVIRSPLKTVRLLAANKRAMRHLAKAFEIILPADCFGSGPGC